MTNNDSYISEENNNVGKLRLKVINTQYMVTGVWQHVNSKSDSSIFVH